ncbi:MAG TPA: ATP-binding cassette domain-containing protein [Acidobacteriaceae bacterium]|nr:ATP-binding cassette domain-containing protein [Acidobacteriaceae bacterium]
MQHVFVARGELTVLHDVCLRVGAQEHVAILGPNGCGKSTLLQTITCQRYPVRREDSRLRIFGRGRWDTVELRKRLGVVSAGFPGEQTPRTSGREAVLSGFFSSSTLWPHQHVTPEMVDRAEETLRRLEALHLRDKPLGQMSSGESRRIMIGRALVHGPQVLLLDEPSNGLDLAAQAELRRTLRRLAGEGVGILLITHHLADILPEMDRVVLMGSGRIIADGPKRDMLTRERLSALFQTEVELTESDGFCHAW